MAQDPMPPQSLPQQQQRSNANGSSITPAQTQNSSRGSDIPADDCKDGLKKGGRIVHRLLESPNLEHLPDSYEDLKDLEYPASMYSAMERYLPSELLNAPRSSKLAVLQQILAKYRPNGERARASNISLSCTFSLCN
jgi:hypothetical protein